MNKLLIEASCVVDEVEYQAVTSEANTCAGCAFKERRCVAAGPCTKASRQDHTSIIWVRAE